jgi:hypothetical protein
MGSGFDPFASPTARGALGLPIRDRLAVRNPDELAPDAALERRAFDTQLEVERASLAGEVLVELPHGLGKRAGVLAQA